MPRRRDLLLAAFGLALAGAAWLAHLWGWQAPWRLALGLIGLDSE